MKIQRTINGVIYCIELLPEELSDAFFEQRNKFDIEDIVSYGEELKRAELQDTLGCTYNEFLSYKEEMATKMRQCIDNYDMRFSDAREYAVKEIIRKNKVAV